jgi:hypothetical protein
MSRTRWAIEWRDDEGSHLVGRYSAREPINPEDLSCYEPLVFKTRLAARIFLDKTYGYIRDRADLRRAPHFWKVPRVVKVTVKVEYV